MVIKKKSYSWPTIGMMYQTKIFTKWLTYLSTCIETSYITYLPTYLPTCLWYFTHLLGSVRGK
jgi:hypothetical protein